MFVLLLLGHFAKGSFGPYLTFDPMIEILYYLVLPLVDIPDQLSQSFWQAAQLCNR